MKYMRLNFLRFKIRNYQVLIDGVNTPLKKIKGGHEIILATEKEMAELVIYNTLPLRSPFWFLLSALIYVVSCFGLFDFSQWRDSIFSYCRIEIPVQDGETLIFTPAPRRRNGIAFQITGRIPLQITDNTNYEDPIAKSRKWILRILRVFATFVVLLIAVVTIVLSIV